jgi:hypothetical protein
MHDIEPTFIWENYYQAHKDKKSPFFGNSYSNSYESTIYGYYIDPRWDFIGSETIYCKLLIVNYDLEYAIIELFGEWNDTLHNDIMWLKREVIDTLTQEGIKKFILLGENIFQFHGGETDYYEEWFEDIEDGWIAAVNFPEFILNEFQKYRLDYYINFGGTLQIENWRTLKPEIFFELVNSLVLRRLG